MINGITEGFCELCGFSYTSISVQNARDPGVAMEGMLEVRALIIRRSALVLPSIISSHEVLYGTTTCLGQMGINKSKNTNVGNSRLY